MIRFEEIDARERLKEYIERDEIYEDYKQDKLMNPSDFEIFCIQHCKDIEEILEENQKLKKQLENTINSYTEKHNLRHNSDLKLDVQKTQQKEFIKYLEDEIEIGTFLQSALKMILQKYKSIIGVSDENNKQ